MGIQNSKQNLKQTSEKFNFYVIVFSFNFQSSLKLIPPEPYHGLFYYLC